MVPKALLLCSPHACVHPAFPSCEPLTEVLGDSAPCTAASVVTKAPGGFVQGGRGAQAADSHVARPAPLEGAEHHARVSP